MAFKSSLGYEPDPAFTQWAIVELMGHKVVAGAVSKDEMLGKPMLRVDVPATSTYPAYTQFYGEAAIYCVTFVSEEVAKHTAEAAKVNPVSVYVPDLVQRQAYDSMVEKYKAEIERLRKGLPTHTTMRFTADSIEFNEHDGSWRSGREKLDDTPHDQTQGDDEANEGEANEGDERWDEIPTAPLTRNRWGNPVGSWVGVTSEEPSTTGEEAGEQDANGAIGGG